MKNIPNFTTEEQKIKFEIIFASVRNGEILKKQEDIKKIIEIQEKRNSNVEKLYQFMQVPIECSIYLDDSIYDLLLERVSHLIV
jgi:uncharacterized membrane protein